MAVIPVSCGCLPILLLGAFAVLPWCAALACAFVCPTQVSRVPFCGASAGFEALGRQYHGGVNSNEVAHTALQLARLLGGLFLDLPKARKARIDACDSDGQNGFAPRCATFDEKGK